MIIFFIYNKTKLYFIYIYQISIIVKINALFEH